jgi:hypothetical protein
VNYSGNCFFFALTQEKFSKKCVTRHTALRLEQRLSDNKRVACGVLRYCSGQVERAFCRTQGVDRRGGGRVYVGLSALGRDYAPCERLRTQHQCVCNAGLRRDTSARCGTVFGGDGRRGWVVFVVDIQRFVDFTAFAVNHIFLRIVVVMNALYHLNLEELTPEFIEALKATFRGEIETVELTLHLNSKPANAELVRRIDNIERGENLVRFEGDEFQNFVEQLLNAPSAEQTT